MTIARRSPPFATAAIAIFVPLAVAFLTGCATSNAHAPAMPVLSWGDQGDGTYRNPILKADYSDPDVIRVGDDFYLVGSDFHFVGIQILHSRDLVNWQIIGQVFNRLTMNARYDTMQGYGQGTWAPSLRYHNGEFYLYVCTPQDGLFMWHTKNPAGPWSETVTVKAVSGWEDPCPFWDDDGQGWLVHSHKGAGPLILHRLSADGTRLLDEGTEIYRGDGSEGPKMYKRHGWYYISLPEGGVTHGGQTVLRAKDIHGPYERRQVLVDGSPHQGGLVELPNGEAWFIAFKAVGFLGRVDHLIPVHWGDDDWPVFGDNGRTVDVAKKPDVGRQYPVARPQASDEFDGSKLSPQWQWNHNPVNEAWSLAGRPGWLRLKAQPADTLSLARNTLTQKIWDDRGTVDVKLDVSRMADDQRAGFAFMNGPHFGWVGVEQTNGMRQVVWDGGTGPVISGPEIWLRGTYENSTGHFAYSMDGQTYTDAPASFTLRSESWKGSRVAIFSYGPSGIADFDYFHYTYGSPAGGAGP